MFEKPTTFILGAGASWHYNYPTGEALIKRIVTKAKILIKCFESERNNNSYTPVSMLPEFFQNLSISNDFRHTKTINMLKGFVERIIDVDPPVIDYFLGWNEDLQNLGRLLIAWVILDAEREYNARSGNYNRQRILDDDPFTSNLTIKSLKSFNDNWYRFVLYKMVSRCQTFDDLLRNDVQFVTFNYDVSLETFLYRGIKAIECLKSHDSKIREYVQSKFIHVYGEIRKDPFSGEVIKDINNTFQIWEYAEVLNTCWEASKGIRTIDPHDKTNDEISQKAQNALIKGSDIFILGYGFDEQNSERLNLKNILSKQGISKQVGSTKGAHQKKIYFTNFGDKNSINKRAGKLFSNNSEIFLPDKTPIHQDHSFVSEQDWNGYAQFYFEKSIRNVYDALESDFDFL